jgi:hypothetical protein
MVPRFTDDEEEKRLEYRLLNEAATPFHQSEKPIHNLPEL